MGLKRFLPVGDSAVNSSVSVGTPSTAVLAANANRQYAVIQNVSSASMFLGFGAAAKNNNGFKLLANSSFTIDQTNLYKGAVNAISSAGAGTVVTVEFSENT